MTHTSEPHRRYRLAGVAVALAAVTGAGLATRTDALGPVQQVAEGGAAHRVRFATGTDHGTVSGALGDGISDRYVLRAAGGQQLTIAGLGALHVSVSAPDGSLLPGGPGDTITFALPATGDYIVEIMPGMGEQSAYQVTFTIPAAPREPAAVRVQFPAGTFGTTVSGRVNGGQLVRYLLRAAPGQTLTVRLDAERAAARFSILAPDGRVLAGEQTAASVALPETGDYTVAVWSIDGNPSYDVAFDIR